MSRIHLCKLFLSIAIAVPSASMANVIITPTTSAATLANNILGPGVTISALSYTGATNQSGTFTNGNSSGIGFNNGIVLSTGNVNQIPGPNNTSSESVGVGNTLNDDVSTDVGTAGDAQLTAIVGAPTHDAAVLQFNFQIGDGSAGGNLFFQYAFASEEYIDYIGSQFNDLFALFVDGVNIALLPGNQIVSINTINCNVNNALYKNNVGGNCAVPSNNLDLSFDGLTTVLTASSLNLGAGSHTMKFAVADTSDGLLDAAVFIQAGTFSNEDQNIPEPSTLVLLGLALTCLGVSRRKV